MFLQVFLIKRTILIQKFQDVHIDLITKDDLQQFKDELFHKMENLFNKLPINDINNLEGYDTKRTRFVLKCSNNKLKSLRIQGNYVAKKSAAVSCIIKWTYINWLMKDF